MSAGGPARRKASLGKSVSADIRHQRRRDRDGAVWLLVGLEQGRNRARQRDAGGIQRVDKLGFLARPGAGPDVRTPRLIVGEGARARDLEPLPYPGRPRLQVVGLGGGET